MAGTINPWTHYPEAVEMFVALWANGDSAAKIAEALRLKFDFPFTRNSVIGKRARMGLPERKAATSSPKPPRVRPPREKRVRVRARLIAPPFETEPYEPIPFEVVSPNPKTLFDLVEKDCRWPLGEGPYTFCANEKLEGRSYCRGHARIAYSGAPRGQERPDMTFKLRRRCAAVQVIVRSMDGEEAA